MTTKEFNKKIENGEAKVLTLEDAKSLKGKKIMWTYFGYYANEQEIFETKVGDIVSEMDYYETQPMEGYKSRAEYWRSYMSKRQLDEVKNTLILLDSDNNMTYIKCHLNSVFFEEDTFTCSDEDRCVYYMEI